MKFFNNIEKMVKTFCADQKSTVMTTTEMDQRIINDSLLAHKKSNNEHSAANQQNIWKTIMKNRITKYAAAVVIILAVAIGITIISGSPPDLAHSAWAEIAKAMQRRSFVHVDIEGSQGEFSARIELWLLFESGIIHQKDYRDGSVVYTDPISNKHYIYHPNYDKIYVDENIITGDPIVRAPRFLQIRTPEELLENLLGTVPQEEITFEEGLYHGIEVEIYTAEWLDTTHPDPRERRNRKVEIIVDRNTHLPLEALSQTSYLEYSPGYLQVKVEKALFDYPEQGPADIYALGVPVDTEVMEQHPLEVAEVIERIDRRRQKGFGAMVAILTTSELDENLQPVKKTLELYGQADERIIYATYEFQTPDRHLWVPPSTMNLVTNWPRPDVYEVLQQGRNSLPNEAYVSTTAQYKIKIGK